MDGLAIKSLIFCLKRFTLFEAIHSSISLSYDLEVKLRYDCNSCITFSFSRYKVPKTTKLLRLLVGEKSDFSKSERFDNSPNRFIIRPSANFSITCFAKSRHAEGMKLKLSINNCTSANVLFSLKNSLIHRFIKFSSSKYLTMEG